MFGPILLGVCDQNDAPANLFKGGAPCHGQDVKLRFLLNLLCSIGRLNDSEVPAIRPKEPWFEAVHVDDCSLIQHTVRCNGTCPTSCRTHRLSVGSESVFTQVDGNEIMDVDGVQAGMTSFRCLAPI